MELKRAFALTLKRVRVQKGVTQGDFSLVSSRTYLSTLECGLKCPTLEKLVYLAAVITGCCICSEGGVEAQEALLKEVNSQFF